MASFNALKKVGPFRLGSKYSNWNFMLAGEVIERLSGVSYGEFVHSRIFQPLQMDRTTTTQNFQSVVDNFAKPYGALEDKSMILLPPPPFLDGTIMVAAQGVQSSVNDMLKFTSALLAGCNGNAGEEPPLKLTPRQLAGHVFRGKQLIGKSYALGLMRALLPNTMGGGSHETYGNVPVINSGSNARIVIYHGGSQAGYTSFMSILPEVDLSLVVLTNSIGFGDPSGWINELLVATLINSPDKTNFIKLATEAADRYLANIPKMMQCIQQSREGAPSRPLNEFVGRYANLTHDFIVKIKQKDEETLQVAFQGLDSQIWDLQHHHHDTFTWLPSLNDIIKRALFPHMAQNTYTIIFETEACTGIKRLLWPHEARLGAEAQYFDKIPHMDASEDKDQPLRAM